MSLVRRVSTYSPRYFVLRRPEESGLTLLGRFIFLAFCILATAVLVFLSYPGQPYAVLAWVAWVPFFWGVLKIRHAKTAFFYAGATAFLFNAGIFYWIFYTCVHGGGMSVWLSCAAWLGLSALLSLQTAFFGAACFYLKKTGVLFPLLAACGFVTLEWLHQTIAFYGLGFPWLMWGYTQWNQPEFLQLAAFTGVYGVSFWLLFINALLGRALALKSVKRGFLALLIAAGVWFALYSWGEARLSAQAKGGRLPLRAALVQPNIDQYKKWDPLFEQEILDTITQTGNELEGKELWLTVWPESVTPGELVEEPYLSLMEDIALRSGAYQIVGSSVTQAGKSYVGAYALAPNSDALQVYRKIKLVPFGEYIPLEKLVRRLFAQVDVLGELGMFVPGPRLQNLLDMGGVLVGSTICYEAVFPQVWLEQSRQGAQVFVNLTNDAWFFNTAAPHQHLAANVLRAVETGRPVLRAANTGISAVIDGFGRIEQKTELFTPAVLYTQVVPADTVPATFYSAYGNIFVWICAVLFFTCLIFAMVFLYE